MRIILSLLLIGLSLNAYADKVQVSCYSQGKLIFNKMMDDSMFGDGYIVARDKISTYFIVGECVIKYKSKDIDVY
jgi:hypothetical protein